MMWMVAASLCALSLNPRFVRVHVCVGCRHVPEDVVAAAAGGGAEEPADEAQQVGAGSE
jgi:hypothetical protein